MKVERERVEKYLEQCLSDYVVDRKAKEDLQQLLYTKYDVSFTRSQMMLGLTESSTSEMTDAELFWVLDCLSEKYTTINLDMFTDIEIEGYRKLKAPSSKVKFPLVIPMIEVSDVQWIGAISAKQLVLWRGSIIRYNKNIQRRLQTVVHGGKTYEKISLLRSAVKKIADLFKQKKFVPNTITLNLDDSADFYYSHEDKALVITKADHLDLTDGYHRLVAISKVIDKDPSFDYRMELRITNFSEEIANQFIWQEEQRTPIPKRDIRSYDSSDVASKITRRVNESSSCNVSGNIVRGGLIDFSTFSDMVDYLFLRGLSEDEAKVALVKIYSDIIQSINAITENDTALITRKLAPEEIKILVYCCREYYGKGKSGVYSLYQKLTTALSSEERRILAVAKEKKSCALLDRLRGDGNV